MRIVALQAVGRRERLILMRLLQVRILRIVAIQAKRRRRFGQMESVLRCRFGACLVRQMAGIATHIERRVSAAFLRHMQSRLVAREAEIFLHPTRHGFQQLILVVAGMRIVACQAVAHRGRMHRSFNIGRFLIRMTGKAKPIRSSGNQLHACDIFSDSDLMAGQAPHGDRGVNRFSLRLILVALKAFG